MVLGCSYRQFIYHRHDQFDRTQNWDWNRIEPQPPEHIEQRSESLIVMTSIKRDAAKQQWEKDNDSEFPLVCETCLGDNPYIRMTREAYGKRCGVCETPFTLFTWQAGTKGRLKRVEICRKCAQAKNVCQVCIFDLQYGLPVKVRDQVLREHGKSEVAGTQIPQSMANRAWYTAQQQRELDAQASNNGKGNDTNILAHAKLREMARMEPQYERNLPRLCSFFARGECDRGSACPFRHEMPQDKNDPLANQNTKARFFGTFDPVANKILEQRDQRKEDDFERSRATMYVRFPVNVELTETQLRDVLYAYGEIISVRCQPNQAFVEYSQPEAVELAIANTNGKELVAGQGTLYCAWARAKDSSTGTSTSAPLQCKIAPKPPTDTKTGSATTKRPLPPPSVGDPSKKQRKIPKGMIAAVKLAPGVGVKKTSDKEQN